jgi:hypothetical protein
MGYRNFTTAIYCTVHDVECMAYNPEFAKGFAFIEKHLKLDKVYLETYRGGFLINWDRILAVKEFFHQKGIKTSGGITAAISTNWEFQTFCYTNATHRERLREIVRFTAELFDEIILDDFFFSNCKCESCIRAKGERSWSQFRMELLAEVSQELVIKTAKKVNPRVQLIIKYPNWYDDYQKMGYNLKEQPETFDGIYSGTETRDPQYTQQDLQRYSSYFIQRFLENRKPGANRGGWFDNLDCLYNLGSYAEQCYLTLFAKAREVTMFCLGTLLYRDNIFVPIAGYVFEQVDRFAGELGNPKGIFCYKPYSSCGENYLHGYLGMLGLPLDPGPKFPTARELIFLTESAQYDPQIIELIKAHLQRGGKAMITSGLLKALEPSGIAEIAEIRVSGRKAIVDQFASPIQECSFDHYYDSSVKIVIPQIEFATNDCFPLIVAFAESKNYPILLQAKYGRGLLYVLTIPDNFGDLYHLPTEILNQIRRTVMGDWPVRLEGPARLGLFVYDNDSFIIESFLPYRSDCQVIINQKEAELIDICSGLKVNGAGCPEGSKFQIQMTPATFRVFRYQVKN